METLIKKKKIDGEVAPQNLVTSASNGHALWQTPLEKMMNN